MNAAPVDEMKSCWHHMIQGLCDGISCHLCETRRYMPDDPNFVDAVLADKYVG